MMHNVRAPHPTNVVARAVEPVVQKILQHKQQGERQHCTRNVEQPKLEQRVVDNDNEDRRSGVAYLVKPSQNSV